MKTKAAPLITTQTRRFLRSKANKRSKFFPFADFIAAFRADFDLDLALDHWHTGWELWSLRSGSTCRNTWNLYGDVGIMVASQRLGVCGVADVRRPEIYQRNHLKPTSLVVSFFVGWLPCGIFQSPKQ
jgi:hypothetical protein